jgi:predicted RNA-binding Zn-ribbon protein involved in translation (DUF1610 family)
MDNITAEEIRQFLVERWKIDSLSELMIYDKIMKAVKLNVAEKPDKDTFYERCPNCKRNLKPINSKQIRYLFCPQCGKSIQWSKDDGEGNISEVREL